MNRSSHIVISNGIRAGLVAACLLPSASAALAGVAGTGDLTLHFEALTGHMTGTISFHDKTYDVLGVDVNMADAVGDMTLDGSAPLDPDGNSGGFTSSLASVTAGRLSYDSVGGYVCKDPAPGCSPDDAAFIGSITNMMGSVVGTDLPSGPTLFYVGDGGTHCGPISEDYHIDCTGTYALNVFESSTTPSGSGVSVISNSTFVNPFTKKVTPLKVELTFDTVDSGGDTVISGVSAAPGLVPSNFQISLPGFDALYFDVDSSATFSGTVEVCITYADSDPSDGFVDGTTVPETALKLLHDEDGTFVDRTTSLNTATNTLCGEVTHFSSFIMPASLPSYCPSTPVDPLSCKGTQPGKTQLAFSSKGQLKWKFGAGDQTFGSDYDDPVGNGNLPHYSLCVYNSGDSPQLIFEASILGGGDCDGKPCWSGDASKGFKFKSKAGNTWGVAGASLKPGEDGKAQIQIKGKGAGLNLPTLPLTGGTAPAVTAQFIVDNGTPKCWSTSYSTAKKNDASQYQAVGP